jgi:toxin ParE1/3/4
MYVFSSRAWADLDEIDAYLSSVNPAARERFLASLHGTLALLARTPGMGRGRDDLRPGHRSFPVGNFLIFYRAAADGIEIVRILDGRRDIQRAFDE